MAANEEIVTSDHDMVRRSQAPPIPRVHEGTQSSKDKPELSEESSSSSEDSETDEDINEKTMSSPAWIMKKAKHCQKCKKNYPTAGEGSDCLTSHNRLRCYFCFRVCKNTENLFRHYERAHRRGDRKGSVVCPCCKESFRFKHVSCHVISVHLTKGKKGQSARANHRLRRDNAVSNKPKLDKLKVGNLDCTLRVERDDGKIFVFDFKKERNYLLRFY